MKPRHFVFVVALAASARAQDTAHQAGDAWRIIPLAQSSLVFARDGTLIGEIGREMRTSVALKSLPWYVPKAFIAVEDQRFYEHDGVDVKAVLGAIKGKVLGENRGGGSTITQQLVGYMHPDIIDRREVSGTAGISRKLREQSAAREMERHYSKDQILEAYLNQINLGRGWFGVEAASRHYFGHPASRLTLAEAATIAGLPKSQPYYDPIGHPDRARERRNLILQKMAEQGFIAQALADKTKLEPIVTAPNGGMSAPSGYFVDAARQQAERAGIPVMNGGYRVYTTLDPALQSTAVTAVVDGTLKIEQQKGYKHLTQAAAKGNETDYLQALAVAIDPYTGDVRALVGGRNYARAPFDRAILARRQPGSSIKPIVYAKAIEDSIPANAIVPDTALQIELPSGDIYKPEEIDGKFWGAVTMREGNPAGAMTMREGLIHSRNMTAIQLGLRVGMDSVAALSQRLGITLPMLPVPASAIGASEVHPIDLVAAYTAFANNGAVVQPRFITRIDDVAGRAVYARPPSTPQQVLDPRVAFIVRDMMRDVTERGSGTAARRAVPRSVPIAGKTGTTNDNVDVWFLGMTPEIVAGVWLGFDRPTTIAKGAVGGLLAAPIWGEMIGKYYGGRTSSGWGPPPDGLVYAEIDRDSAGLATPATPPDKRYVEYFLPGTEPPELRNNPWKVPRWGPLFVPLKAGNK
ncbi:MAG TPA: transglycosylase domain-containing protein [Gemmatimonadaceae bacterium]|nr:transglycosylase domain-containing protein [Gemmatimonadaceae bacterium]